MLKKYTFFLFLFAILFGSFQVNAQCPNGQSKFKLTLVPDGYPNEISWDLKDLNGITILSGGSNSDSICIPNGTCFRFSIHDSYGDGLLSPGYYNVSVNNVIISAGSNYGHGESTDINCPPGTSCASALTATTGGFVAPSANTWYKFTPDSTGMYEIKTCGVNTCDTKLWVYDHCSGLTWDNTNIGTLLYNDDGNNCAPQSEITAQMEAGHQYIIRVGSNGTSCSGQIFWNLSYLGPISGCMDQTACNYNPLATISDGNCIYPGDPLCPNGPDLTVIQSEIETSLTLATITASNCQVVENCLTGYGDRTIIRFGTHIKNLGNQDYFIGNPTANPTQFTYGNCHGHWHYEGYAEYILYDISAQPLPIGFKNGFCVLDLECSGGGIAQYGCGNMGISVGCGDIYSSGLDCQWIDITDVDTGLYTLVVRVNWDNSPDALGHVETNLNNNWAQVCIRIAADAAGNKTFTQQSTCNPYIDCAGQVYGSAVHDCNGNCGGNALMGDLDQNLDQNTADVQAYIGESLNASGVVGNCNDLNGDGIINVYDAALINACANYGSNYQLPLGGTHNYCDFPSGLTNINDTVSLRLGNINYIDNYVDVEMLNPDNKVEAYQFNMHGISIINVLNLANTGNFQNATHFVLNGNTVVGLSFLDSTINKNNVFTGLCRIYFSSITDTIICIQSISDIVNNVEENVIHKIVGPCIIPSFTGIVNRDINTFMMISPNPSKGVFDVFIKLEQNQNVQVSIVDLLGQEVYNKQFNNVQNGKVSVNLENQAKGVYIVSLKTATGVSCKKIIIE